MSAAVEQARAINLASLIKLNYGKTDVPQPDLQVDSVNGFQMAKNMFDTFVTNLGMTG